jgi:Protein of unknown function (DUF1549)
MLRCVVLMTRLSPVIGRWSLVVLVLCLCRFNLAAAPLSAVSIAPAEVRLSTAQARQALAVQATFADGTTRDVTDKATFAVADKKLARIEKGIVQPLADGKTEIVVKYDGRTQKIPLTIEQAVVERTTSFKLDVVPALTKAGCNSGGCHGASRGKDGFRLSLFGYDPDGDYARITREQIGRRINLGLPEESLLLEKGLGTVTHTGGERWQKQSETYQAVLRWIQDGAPKDATNVPSVVGIDIAPKQAVLEGSNTTQRLVVRAKYSDGVERDVTSLAVFISNNEPSARVSELGVISAGQKGEAFVMGRFDAFTVGMQVIVVPKGEKFEFPKDLARNNYIDDLVHAKLRKLRMRPSDLCDDATFIRRATLDITGQLPTPEELKKFLTDESPAKREHLVEGLLNRPEFADLWVMKFAELLQIRSRQDQFSQKAALAYFNWLRDRLLTNVPIDRIVREQHLGRSGGELLSGLDRHAEDRGEHRAGLHGHAHPVRAVPQSSVRPLDDERLLRFRELLLAGRAQAGRGSAGLHRVRPE